MDFKRLVEYINTLIERTILPSLKNFHSESSKEISEAIEKASEKQMKNIFDGLESIVKGKDGKTPTNEQILKIVRPLISDSMRGAPGHTPTDDELLALIKPLIPEVKDGETPTKEELSSLIKALMPDVEDGYTPQKGIDYVDGKDGSPDTPKDIVKKLESLKGEQRLDAKAIKNLPMIDRMKGVFGRAVKTLKNLSDVNVPSPSDNQFLTYDSASGKWVSTDSGNIGKTYLLTNDSGTYNARNGSNGTIDYTGSDFDVVLASVKAAIGTTNPAVIELGPGTFVTTTGVSFAQSNLVFEGQGMGATILQGANTSALDSTGIFKIETSTTGSAYSLTANANAGDLTVTISSANLIASGIVAGDYILIRTSKTIDTEFSGRNQGEIHKVISVNTGTGVITIGASLNGTHVYQTMLTSDSAVLVKFTGFRENITIRNLTVTDAATSRPDTLAVGSILIGMANNILIENVACTDVFDTGIHVRQTMNVKIKGCYIRNVKDVTPNNNNFYGVQIRGAATNTVVTGCSFDNMRHAVTTGAGSSSSYMGTTRNVTIVGNSSISTTTAHFDAHQACEGLTISANTMVGDDGSANGIQSRSPGTFSDNSIIGVLGLGISLFGDASGSTISGNDIKGCLTGVNISNGVTKANIIGNTIRAGLKGIEFNRTTHTVTISNASPAVITYSSHAICAGTVVSFSTTGALPAGLTAGTTYYVISSGITNTTFQVSATPGGAAINTSDAGSGTHTIRYYSGNDSTVADNVIIDNSSNGIASNGQSNMKISGNTFRNNLRPILMLDTDSKSDSWMITDNYSKGHTTSDAPTILGTNHSFWNNVGFGNTNITDMVVPDETYGVGWDSSLEVPTKNSLYDKIETLAPKVLTLRTVATTATSANTDDVIECDTTSGGFTLNLHAIAGATRKPFYIKKIAAANTLTIDGNSAETIDGSATLALTGLSSATLIPGSGTNWLIV